MRNYVHCILTSSQSVSNISIQITISQLRFPVRDQVTYTFFYDVGWDWVHLVRRTLVGLLYQPRMVDEYAAVCAMRIGRGNRTSFSHQWLYSPLLVPDLFFSFVIFFRQTVGLLGRVISTSQGRCIHTGEHKYTSRINAQRHTCLKWDSNPKSQRLRERRE
jgi:hypothetical protein